MFIDREKDIFPNISLPPIHNSLHEMITASFLQYDDTHTLLHVHLSFTFNFEVGLYFCFPSYMFGHDPLHFVGDFSSNKNNSTREDRTLHR